MPEGWLAPTFSVAPILSTVAAPVRVTGLASSGSLTKLSTTMLSDAALVMVVEAGRVMVTVLPDSPSTLKVAAECRGASDERVTPPREDLLPFVAIETVPDVALLIMVPK